MPTVQAMVSAEPFLREQRRSLSGGGSKMNFELEGLTAGAVADMCNVSRDIKRSQLREDEDPIPYAPLEPMNLPAAARPPHIEPGRVEIRLMALYDKLDRI